MIEGIHLTPIGDGNVLLEPGEGLDPGNPESMVAAVCSATPPALSIASASAGKSLLASFSAAPTAR